MNWFILALRNSFNFKGRARRKEYGWFIVGSALIGFIVGLLEGAAAALGLDPLFMLLSVLDMIINLVLFIAGISVTTRRLHDLGYSGWWQLLPTGGFMALIVVAASGALIGVQNSSLFSGFIGIAAILAFVLFIAFGLWLIFKDGQRFANKYGDDPKAPQTPQINF